MLVVITYDVNTETAAGRKRLRQIAKQCVNYGQRVQNSVFECLLDAAQCRMLQAKLVSIMDEELDSLRFYYLGNQYEQKIQHFGRNAGYQPEGVDIAVVTGEIGAGGNESTLPIGGGGNAGHNDMSALGDHEVGVYDLGRGGAPQGGA